VVTAMETFCGQAHGAKRYSMVGVVLQRAMAITLLFCGLSVALWWKGTQLLLWMGEQHRTCPPASLLRWHALHQCTCS